MSPKSRTAKSARGVTLDLARRLILALPGVEEGSSYGMPSFKVNSRFFGRFRDADTVLVLQLGSIAERDVLMQLDPEAFFFTEHYRNYPAVLVRLAAVPRGLLEDLLGTAHEEAIARPSPRGARRAPPGKARRARRS